jgi:uroporphyrinogen decarboxylase
MYNVDLKEFWAKDELSHNDNCFSKDAPQVALGIRMSDECVFAELYEEGHPWDYTPQERRVELNKRYNEKAIKIVGIPLLSEQAPLPSDAYFPAIKRIGEIFGGRYFIHNHTEWLEGSVSTPGELEKLLERIEKINIREFFLPANWEQEKKRIFEKYGSKPGQFRGIRGPVTLATSIYGVENLIFLIFDYPDLARRLSKVVADISIKIAHIMDEEAGYSEDNAPHGFWFCDDNCCMLNDEMYQLFGYPVLKRVFDEFCPNENDERYQHSDSAMSHLIPILSKSNLTSCNFGPTVTIDEIRKYMPNTRIDGQLAPYTFMRNDEEAIIAEVKRDCEMAKRNGRGVNLFTAGSINNGSLLTSMRAVMYAIQEYGQY